MDQISLSQSTFFQYIPGDINLILTNPHGGQVIPDPDYMRNRTPGCYDEATGACTYDSSLLDCESSVRTLICKGHSANREELTSSWSMAIELAVA